MGDMAELAREQEDMWYDIAETVMMCNLENKVWETKGGKKIKFKDMTDSHLNNTIRYIERQPDYHYFHMFTNALKAEQQRRK